MCGFGYVFYAEEGLGGCLAKNPTKTYFYARFINDVRHLRIFPPQILVFSTKCNRKVIWTPKQMFIRQCRGNYSARLPIIQENILAVVCSTTFKKKSCSYSSSVIFIFIL